MKNVKSFLDDQEAKKEIRRAARRGRTTITLRGVEFSIERKDYDRNFDVTVMNKDTGKSEKTHVTKTEKWLLLKPTDPRKSLPVFEIELVDGQNLRSQF